VKPVNVSHHRLFVRTDVQRVFQQRGLLGRADMHFDRPADVAQRAALPLGPLGAAAQ
jgi:hypothetical protein